MRVPVVGIGAVTEGGKPVATAPGSRSVTTDGAYAVVQVGAGTYRFQSSRVPAAFAASTTASSAGAWEAAAIIGAIVLAVGGGVIWFVVHRVRESRPG